MATPQSPKDSTTGTGGTSASATSAGSSTGSTANRPTPDASTSSGTLVDGVQDRFREASEDVRHGAERAGEEIRRGYERASQVARENYDKVEQDFQGLSTNLDGYVRENPGKAVLFAAGAGFLIGLLMRNGEG